MSTKIMKKEDFINQLIEYYKANPDLQADKMNEEQKKNYEAIVGYVPVKISVIQIAAVLELVSWFLSHKFPEEKEQEVTMYDADGYLYIKSYI
jgi:hypothetical protein